MQRLGKELLSGPALPADHHKGIVGGHLQSDFLGFADGRAFANDVGKCIVGGMAFRRFLQPQCDLAVFLVFKPMKNRKGAQGAILDVQLGNGDAQLLPTDGQKEGGVPGGIGEGELGEELVGRLSQG